MTTDNRTNEQILRDVAWTHPESERAAVAKLQVEALRAAGRLAGKPTEAQIEAAAKALRDDRANRTDLYVVPVWEDTSYGDKLVFRGQARAALVAAQGAAPQAVNVEKLLTVIGVALDVTKADVRGEIEASIRREVSHWLGQGDDVVLPSITVDETALAKFIRSEFQRWWDDESGTDEELGPFLARAVAAWLEGRGGESRGE